MLVRWHLISLVLLILLSSACTSGAQPGPGVPGLRDDNWRDQHRITHRDGNTERPVHGTSGRPPDAAPGRPRGLP